MNTNPNFPVDLTPEEKQAGFQLVQTRLPLQDADTTIAALPVSPSARIVKAAAMPLFPGDKNFGYLLEVYCRDTHFMMRGRGKPRWDLVWSGTSSTLEAALHRFQTEPLPPSLELLDPTADSSGEQSDSDVTGTA